MLSGRAICLVHLKDEMVIAQDIHTQAHERHGTYGPGTCTYCMREPTSDWLGEPKSHALGDPACKSCLAGEHILDRDVG